MELINQLVEGILNAKLKYVWWKCGSDQVEATCPFCGKKVEGEYFMDTFPHKADCIYLVAKELHQL